MVNEAQGKYLVYNGVLEKTEMSERFENIELPVYEVMAVKDGVVLYIEDHLNRLKSTLERKNLVPVRSVEEIIKDTDQLIDKNSIDTGYIKMLLTEEGVLVYQHWDLEQEESINVSILDYQRNDPALKVLDNNYKVQVSNLMMEQNTFEVLLRSEDGELVEGGRSNLYFIKDDKVVTAPKDRVLPGITRGRINKILDRLSIPLEEGIVYDYELLDVQGAFISGTTVGISPINMIESIEINSIKNPIMKRIISEYDKDIKEYVQSKKNK